MQGQIDGLAISDNKVTYNRGRILKGALMQTSAFGFQFACAKASPLDPISKIPMATYHLSVKTISRSHGRSATAAAAYRAGARITDERTGITHDYRRRHGVESTVLLVPTNAPDWATDRERLWNAAELAETRKNSTVAREFEIALPAELDSEQRQRLVADFACELVLRHGCAADMAIHQPGRDGDQRNYHAHILLSTRRLTAAGFGAKTRELDDLKSGEIRRWRQRFADLQNERLHEAGAETQVDHRSLETQEIDREPTIHLGPIATALERRGVSTWLGESNRAVQARNAERQRDVEAWPAEPLAAEAEAEVHASVQENIIQALREKTAQLYQTAVLPSFEEEVFTEPLLVQLLPPPKTTEAERQRREAKRQALLSADIVALERELAEWTHHQAWLARHESPPATWLADKGGELACAKREATAAKHALDALEVAYADWRKAHRLALLLPTRVPGSQRRAEVDWVQRVTEARTTLEQAQIAFNSYQNIYNSRLPAAEREAQQLAEDRRRQLTTLQGQIDERNDLIQRVKVVQVAERERLDAEAKCWRQEAEQRKTQEPERSPAEPLAPKQEPPEFAIPAPRPKPRYPTPGG